MSWAWRHATALGVFLAALAGSLSGQAAQAQTSSGEGVADRQVIVVNLPVILDGRSIGAAPFGIVGNQIAFVEADGWEALSQGRLSSASIEQTLNASENGVIPVEAVAAAGIELVFDAQNLVITLTTVDTSRALNALSVRADRVDYDDVSGFDAPGRSFYVNAFFEQEYFWRNEDRDARGSPLRLSFDGATRPFGANSPTLEWAAFYDDARVEDPWIRGDTRIVYDDIRRAIRYSAGDISFRGSEFQGAPPLLGASVERRFSEVNPLSIVSPTGRRSFTLTRRARVQVFVNGFFQRTLELQPGRYELSDFAFNSGVNDVEIIIDDEVGEQERLSFSLFLDNSLLSEGVSEFSLNVGSPRSAESIDRIDYDFDQVAWSGFYRRGFTDWLTAGVNAQGEGDLQVYGAEISIASPVGLFASSASVSRSDDHGDGAAASARWAYDAFWTDSSQPHEFDVAVVYFSDDFLDIAQGEPLNPFELQARAQYSFPLPFDAFASIDTRYARPRDTAEADETALGLRLSARLNRSTLSVAAERVTGELDETNVQLRLTVPFGPRHSVVSSWDSTIEQSSIEFNRFSRAVVGDISGSAAVRSVDDSLQAEFVGRYSANRFDGSVTHQYLESINDAPATQSTRVRAGSSLAFVDGTVGVGQPISDSFALVRRHPSLRGTRVLVNPIGDTGYTAVADALGPALVPTLNSYLDQSIQWEADNPPLGYDLGDTEREFLPRFRSGVVYTAGSAASITAVGIARYSDGEAVALVAGVVRAADGRDFPEARTFTNRAGRFAAQALEPGLYEVVFQTTPPTTFLFRIEDDAVGVVNLDQLTLLEN